MTDASLKALAALRDASHMHWYVIPMLASALYAYSAEMARKNWHAVLASLILYVAECFWEILNALVLHFSGYSAVWTTPGDSAFIILAGLNIEITFMFFVAGIVVINTLPGDKLLKIAGIPNRLLIPLLWGLFCVLVEVLLNRSGLLVWDWPWWNWPNCYLIIPGYTLPFLAMVWIYDNLSIAAKKRLFAGVLAVVVTSWLVFVNVLGWI